MVIYAFVIIATLHTMFIHETCRKKKLKQLNVNLFLFYFLAVCVCLGRYISLISIYLAVKEDNALRSFYYNYGYFTATFSIILIAVQQINSINTATLKTRFVIAYQQRQEPDDKPLNLKLSIMNIITVLIDLAFIIYYSITIVRYHMDLDNSSEGYAKVLELDQTVTKFVSIVMCIVALCIWISFFFMFRTFIGAVNL